MYLVVAGKDSWLGLGSGKHREEVCRSSTVSSLAIDALLSVMFMEIGKTLE